MKSGTSFDPSLQGELRVTVVATGLNGPNAKARDAELRVAVKPPSVVTSMWGNVASRNRSAAEAEATGHTQQPPMSIARTLRGSQMPSGLAALELNEELLDIPAFLRAQAD